MTVSILDAQLAEELLRRRSSTTGGWGYTSDQLAVEPTALTLVALWSWNRWNGPRDWLQPLRSAQLPDGQWPMIASDERGSPWATALAAIALLRLSSPDNVLERALVSLVRSEPKEAFWLWRLKFRAQDKHVRFDPTKFGWSWVPGTLSWVVPTSMALIALQSAKLRNSIHHTKLGVRITGGAEMLLNRMCPRGGWNAGNSVVYGVPLTPHIDATSLAIAALRFHYHLPEVRQSLCWLLAAKCSSAYSLAWKILALRSYLDVRSDVALAIAEARGQLVTAVRQPTQIADNSTLALSLLALKDNANPFSLERPA